VRALNRLEAIEIAVGGEMIAEEKTDLSAALKQHKEGTTIQFRPSRRTAREYWKFSFHGKSRPLKGSCRLRLILHPIAAAGAVGGRGIVLGTAFSAGFRAL